MSEKDSVQAICDLLSECQPASYGEEGIQSMYIPVESLGKIIAEASHMRRMAGDRDRTIEGLEATVADLKKKVCVTTGGIAHTGKVG